MTNPSQTRIGSEQYYAEMEGACNLSEDAYFSARPQVDTIRNRALFKAGFERAWGQLWNCDRPKEAP